MLLPGYTFTASNQAGKEPGNCGDQTAFQHERHLPSRQKDLWEVASLAMAHQTLRSINCPLVSAVLTSRRPGSPYLVSFPEWVGVRTAPAPTTLLMEWAHLECALDMLGSDR